MLDEPLLEVRTYDGPGFRPLIFFDSWRVALMNYAEGMEAEAIQTVERHPQTDEVFVLLDGRAILFYGEGRPELERLHAQPMEPGILYNVKPQTLAHGGDELGCNHSDCRERRYRRPQLGVLSPDCRAAQVLDRRGATPGIRPGRKLEPLQNVSHGQGGRAGQGLNHGDACFGDLIGTCLATQL
ncbi:MAG: hypothetical protein RMJ60_06740 [Anaerolineales bacterium]|nr:hypothetical protein [Anaerolineales bacterium]